MPIEEAPVKEAPVEKVPAKEIPNEEVPLEKKPIVPENNEKKINSIIARLQEMEGTPKNSDDGVEKDLKTLGLKEATENNES